MAALVVTMINLSAWQFRRLSQRKAFNHAVELRLAEPAVPLEGLLTTSVDPKSIQWRDVIVTGTYEPKYQVLIRDRSLNSVAGFNVVTPLDVGHGQFVVVERGWISSEVATPPAPPTGTVTIEGRLQTGQLRRHSWEKADPKTGVLSVLSRVDIGRIDQQTPGTAARMFVDVAASEPRDPSVQPIPLPVFDDGPHLSYAVQWIMFSLAAIVGWVLAVRKSANDRRRDAAKAAKAASGSVATS
jgi:cytochrome oxidase assembly protein ShyY1